ncbi:hypothetical protein [Escherichia phage IMM-001]|nr:hypothetical protein [Escherichia phage IMM-001]
MNIQKLHVYRKMAQPESKSTCMVVLPTFIH